MSNASTPEEIKRGKSIYDQGMQSEVRNSELRTASNERKNKLSYSKLSDLGVTNEMSIEQAMAQLNNSKVGKDQSTVNAIDNTIQDLKTASETLGSTATVYAAKVAQAKADFEKSSGFTNNMVIGFKNLGKEADEMVDQLGRNLPGMFADGLVDGIKAAIRESDNLGQALMGIAGKFLDEISTIMMRSAIYGMLGNMGMGIPGVGQAQSGKQKGGYIRAQSGTYVSGTGSGDKYPAMLENGEYVLNRNAVMAMGGPSEIDKLNFSMAPRFASGGSFATELTDLKSMEEGMTTYGLENSKLYNELRDVEKAKQAEKRRKAFERKKMIAGIVGSVAGMVVSLGIMKGVGALNQPANLPKGGYAATPAGQLEIGASLNSSPEMLSTGASNTAFFGSPRQTGGLIGNRLSDTIPAYAEGGLYGSPIIKKYGVGMENGGMYGGSSNNSNTVSNTNATNSFNFNTTVNRDGAIQMGADSTSYKQQDVELSNNLNSQVYKTVLDVIKQQQRFGGTLAGTRRPI